MNIGGISRAGASLALLSLVAGCSGSGTSASSASASSAASQSIISSRPVGDLANPPEVVSANGVAALTLRAVINPSTGGPALQWNGSLIPPTIRVSPGDTVNITYVNALPVTSAEPLNTISLHFHGLAVSPNPPGDDAIDTFAMPGQTLHYHMTIPPSQPPGLYWYHSHTHLEANWQVYNGMSGALVVDGTGAFSRETAGLPERVIILRNVLSQSQYSDLAIYRRTLGSRRVMSAQAAAPSPCSQPWGLAGEHTTINDRSPGAALSMQPGRKQFWRIVNASADGYYDLHVDGQTLHLVSIDGVPIQAYPGGREEDVPDVTIPPAGRAEFIVNGSSGNSALRTTCTDTGPAGDPNPPQILAEILPTAPQMLPMIPAPGATMPAHGTFESALGAPVKERSLAFTESSDGDSFYLNNTQYSPTAAPMFTVASGTVERWTLSNATQELHAFHIHQIHFIVQDVDGVPMPPRWTDTVTMPIAHPDGSASLTHVFLDFRDPIIRGTFLFHCHLLEHEDNGMMAKIQVL